MRPLGETVIQFTIRGNLGKTPQQIVEHVHCANYEVVQRFSCPVFFGQINMEH